MAVHVSDDHSFAVVVDVLIVGGGACGLTAALAAVDAGGQPLVLERWTHCAGSSAMSLGALCAAGSAQQKSSGIDDDAETFLADIMSKSGGRADPVVARAITENSGPALDWLASKHAVEFELDQGWRPAFGHSRRRMHAVAERTGADMMARLVSACERAGVDIVTQAEVTDLFVTSDSHVTGVSVRRPDGAMEEIGCKALVLATCGFGANRDMIARHIPRMRDARYFGWDANRGDAMLWGEALGAAFGDMDAYQGLGLLADPHGIDVNPKILIEGGVQINAEGLRFSHELDDVSGQGARVIAQTGGYGWVIYDRRIHHMCEAFPQYRSLMELNAARSAPTAAALARLINVPTDALTATLDNVTSLQKSGGVDRFGRRFEAPALEAPFYALKVTGAIFHTQGGLEITGEGRVKRLSGDVFENLFAGGGAARGISGPGPSGYLPGAGLCTAVTLGYLAGRAAAHLVLS